MLRAGSGSDPISIWSSSVGSRALAPARDSSCRVGAQGPPSSILSRPWNRGPCSWGRQGLSDYADARRGCPPSTIVSAIATATSYGARRRDADDQRERGRGNREDGERGQSQQPGARDVPSASRMKMIWASRNSAGPPNVRIVKPSVGSSPGWAIASSSPTAMPISASTINVSVQVPQ